MPRKMVPCARCDKPLHTGPHSSPAGLRTCQECRREAPVRRSERVCEHSGCGRPHKAKGYCLMHYKQRRPRSDRLPTALVGAIAWKHGVYAPKDKVVKCRVTIGVMIICPCCDAVMGATSPVDRICPTCFTTLRLNAEEVSWVIYEARSMSQSMLAS